MRAAKPLAAVLAALGLFATAPATLARGDVTNIHLVNVIGFKHYYLRALKADVSKAYQGNVTPIQFSTTGKRVYLEWRGQRVTDSGPAYYRDRVACYHSDRRPSPDAVVTVDGREAHDSAVVTLAVSEIINGDCSP